MRSFRKRGPPRTVWQEAGASTDGMAGIVVSYLAATEALSVIENLSDAGVSSMTELLKKLRGR